MAECFSSLQLESFACCVVPRKRLTLLHESSYIRPSIQSYRGGAQLSEICRPQPQAPPSEPKQYTVLVEAVKWEHRRGRDNAQCSVLVVPGLWLKFGAYQCTTFLQRFSSKDLCRVVQELRLQGMHGFNCSRILRFSQSLQIS